MNMDLVTNHWDMLQLLSYTALGAKVTVERIPEQKESTAAFRKYTLSIEGVHPGSVVTQTNVYALPCSSEMIQKHVKETLAKMHEVVRNQRASVSS